MEQQDQIGTDQKALERLLQTYETGRMSHVSKQINVFHTTKEIGRGFNS